jgi:CheY-like chemotaxis protein
MDAVTSYASENPPNWTILLVEDEESVRQITKHVLESAGYLVLDASSPEQAIAIFHRFASASWLVRSLSMRAEENMTTKKANRRVMKSA